MRPDMCKYLFLILFIAVSCLLASAGDIIDDASNDFRKFSKEGDSAKAKAAITMIARANNLKAAKALLKIVLEVPKENDELYWAALNGIAAVDNAEAGQEIITFLSKNMKKPIAVDLVFILKSNPNDKMIPVMETVLKDGTAEMKELAVDYISSVESDKAALSLINALGILGANDATIKSRIVKILESRSGETFGENIAAWKQWLDENKDSGGAAAAGAPAPKAADTAKDMLDSVRKSEVENIGKGSGEIIVIDGKCVCGQDHSFDHIQETLKQLGIPHTVVSRPDFDADSYRMDDKVAIIFNCNMYKDHCICPTCKPSADKNMRLYTCTGCDIHDKRNNKFSDKTIEKIRNYVANGGYIFTEDWELEEVLERAFPEYVGHTAYLSEQQVKILPEKGAAAHPYLKGVFERPVKAVQGGDAGKTMVEKPQLKVGDGEWKIDQDSPNLVVKKAGDVAVLMVSPELKKIDAEADSVAVTFRYTGKKKAAVASGGGAKPEGGSVLHVLSHFGKQKSKTDAFALQYLLLNFLADANQAFKNR